MHVIAPAVALQADPLPHAVASFPLAEAAAAQRSGGVALPEGAGRFVVTIEGTESEEDIASLRVRPAHSLLAAMVLAVIADPDAAHCMTLGCEGWGPGRHTRAGVPSEHWQQVQE